jgi:uncharacterized membrane protein (UPF0136 family)
MATPRLRGIRYATWDAMTLGLACVFGVIGLMSAGGGFIGFKKAGSKASLIAGSVSGAVLLAAAALLAQGATTLGLAVAGLTCLALAGRFVPAYLKTRKPMPQGIMALLSSGGLLTAILAAAFGG